MIGVADSTTNTDFFDTVDKNNIPCFRFLNELAI